MFCIFKDCINPVEHGKEKCKVHKHRKVCKIELCQNQIYARGLCVRHGGKRHCSAPNCTRNVRVENFCIQHSNKTQKKLFCTEEGCQNIAHSRQKCVRHGGGRKCQVPECTTHARTGGTCCRHASIARLNTTSNDSFLKIIDQVMLAELDNDIQDLMGMPIDSVVIDLDKIIFEL